MLSVGRRLSRGDFGKPFVRTRTAERSIACSQGGSVAAPLLAAHNRSRGQDADSKAPRAYAQTSLSQLDRMWRAED